MSTQAEGGTTTRSKNVPLGRIEVKELIEDALATISKQIVNLPSREFIQDTIKDVTEALTKRITEQETKIFQLEDRIEKLESKLAVLDRLETRIDDGEQYSRRHCLCIHDMELPPVGTKENCLEKTKNVIEKLNCGVGGDAIDRAHRIGPVIKNDSGKTVQQIIVRLKSFKDRTSEYKNRKKATNGARIRLDLTKKRLKTLLAVKDLNRADIDYAFTDINCNLVAKLKDGKFILFTSVEALLAELDKNK